MASVLKDTRTADKRRDSIPAPTEAISRGFAACHAHPRLPPLLLLEKIATRVEFFIKFYTGVQEIGASSSVFILRLLYSRPVLVVAVHVFVDWFDHDVIVASRGAEDYHRRVRAGHLRLLRL